MKKQVLFVFAGLWLAVSAIAQKEMPVILIDSKGKVCYQSPVNSKKQRIITGAVLLREGTLELPEGAEGTLYADGKFVQATGKKVVPLRDVFPITAQLVNLDFEITFGEYVTAAVEMAAGAEDSDGWGRIDDPKNTGDGWGKIDDPKNTGDGWGRIDDPKNTGDGWGRIDDPKNTGDGWGGHGNNITPIMPFGKIHSGTTLFSWSKPEGASKFEVKIFDEEDKLLMQRTVQDTFVEMDLQGQVFKAGATYFWTVRQLETALIQTATLEFQMAAAESKSKALTEAKGTNLYANSTPTVQGLMEAVSYEFHNWYGAAADRYDTLQKANPDNELVRLMHAAFWMRWGLKEKAMKLYTQK